MGFGRRPRRFDLVMVRIPDHQQVVHPVWRSPYLDSAAVTRLESQAAGRRSSRRRRDSLRERSIRRTTWMKRTGLSKLLFGPSVQPNSLPFLQLSQVKFGPQKLLLKEHSASIGGSVCQNLALRTVPDFSLRKTYADVSKSEFYWTADCTCTSFPSQFRQIYCCSNPFIVSLFYF